MAGARNPAFRNNNSKGWNSSLSSLFQPLLLIIIAAARNIPQARNYNIIIS
jgi:hypothetical protein